MPQLESEPEHCFVCGAPATRRIKGDWYCSKHTPYKEPEIITHVKAKYPFRKIPETITWKGKEESISEKVWQIRNERLRELPMDCRIAIIEEIVKADVRRCIESSGIHDPICQSMAEESGDMEEYLLSKNNPGHKTKCDKNPCDLKIKGKRDELAKAAEERVERIRWEQKEFGKLGLFEGIDTECGYCGSHDTTFYTDEKGWTFRRCNSCHKQDNITTLVGRHKRS